MYKKKKQTVATKEQFYREPRFCEKPKHLRSLAVGVSALPSPRYDLADLTRGNLKNDGVPAKVNKTD